MSDLATIEIDAGTRAEVIDGVLSRLRAAYVFPAVAERMEEAVRRRMEAGDYDTVTTASSLVRHPHDPPVGDCPRQASTRVL